MKLFLILSLLAISAPLLAQSPVESQMYAKMDQAAELMEQGKYEEANEVYLYVLKHMTALPSDLAFYFGKNSYHLDKYKQSINWLNKYIQLKGTQGRFYDEAVKYLQYSEEEYLKIAQQNTADLKSDLSGEDYDCGGLEKMICPVCRGQGVVIKQGPFDLIYKTCPYSAGEPYLTCEEYNLFMKGQLEPKDSN